MPKYRISARRTTIYEVEAEHNEAAIDAMMEGKATEVHGETHEIIASPLCPECGDLLTNSTTRTVVDDSTDDDPQTWEEPAYCDTCDREVLDVETGEPR